MQLLWAPVIMQCVIFHTILLIRNKMSFCSILYCNILDPSSYVLLYLLRFCALFSRKTQLIFNLWLDLHAKKNFFFIQPSFQNIPNLMQNRDVFFNKSLVQHTLLSLPTTLLSFTYGITQGITRETGFTPARTLFISGLKSRVLKLPFFT